MASNKLNTILFNFLRGFAPVVFNFTIALVGFKSYGGDNWGDLAGIIIVLFFFNFLSSWGNKEFLIRSYSETPQKIESLFFTNLFSRAILLLSAGLLFFIYSWQIAVIAIGIVFFRYIYNSLDSLVIYHQKFATQFFTELVAFIIVMGAIFMRPNFSLELLLGAYLIGAIVKTILLWIALNPKRLNGTVLFDSRILVLMLPFFFISLGGWLHSKIDLYLVEFNLSSAELARYQILVGAYIMLDAVSAFMVQPFSKHIYRLDEHAIDKMRRVLRWTGIPIILLGSGSIYFFLNYFTAVDFTDSYYLVLTLGAIPPFFYMIDIFLLYRYKREKLIMKISFTGAAINLGIGLLLIPDYGLFGAVLGVSIAKWVMLIVPYFVKKHQKENLIET